MTTVCTLSAALGLVGAVLLLPKSVPGRAVARIFGLSSRVVGSFVLLLGGSGAAVGTAGSAPGNRWLSAAATILLAAAIVAFVGLAGVALRRRVNVTQSS